MSVTINGIKYNIKETQSLKLDNRGLTSLPASIGKFTELMNLILMKNQLTKLPASIGNLTKLWGLNLWSNKLTSLPASIGNLTNLLGLDVTSNQLTKLPESIGKLTELEYLFLSNNQLTSLPESIGDLTKLKTLDVSSNQLTSLPKSIKKLQNTSIRYNDNLYNNGKSFYKHFYSLNHIVRVSRGTELFTNTFNVTNKISNIPPNKRVYINKNSNVKNNGELRRLYNINGINEYMRGRTFGQLHGNKFNMYNVIPFTKTVNKNVYLRNIRVRLSNVPLNRLMNQVAKIKQNLPSNVSRNDVNVLFRNLKPTILKKIRNKLNNSPSSNRVRIINTMKNRGIINNTDINKLIN